MSRVYREQTEISPKVLKFNLNAALSLGWAWALRWLDLTQNSFARMLAKECVTYGAESVQFAVAAQNFQRAEGLEPDGACGIGTWRRLIAIHEAASAQNGIDLQKLRCGGAMVGLVKTDRYRLEPFSSFQLDKLGGYKAGRVELDLVVVHWGGFDVQTCFNALANRKLSSHFLASSEIEEDGDYVIYQSLDIAHTAWHAPPTNQRAIGIDICRSPLAQHAKRYANAPVVRNPSGRGDKLVADLDPEVGARVCAFLADLAKKLQIPFRDPGMQVYSAQKLEVTEGVIGHHNVSANKWDVAPWVPHIWPAAE